MNRIAQDIAFGGKIVHGLFVSGSKDIDRCSLRDLLAQLCSIAEIERNLRSRLFLELRANFPKGILEICGSGHRQCARGRAACGHDKDE